MTHNRRYNVYIASCDKDGGIYRYQFNSNDGTLNFTDFVKLDRPMYMSIKNRKLYALMRAPFKDNNESGLIEYDITDDGSIINPSKIISTHGEVACHITADGENVYCVNYISGSVTKIPDIVVKHEGKGTAMPRQSSPHTHYVGLTPDNKYLCVTDLGLDKIFLYDKNLKYVSEAKVPSGHGARHLVFSDCGKYCFVVNELESTVSAFRYCNGVFEYIDTCSCLPKNFGGESTAAAIRFYDNEIYVSNRGHDSISVLEFKNDRLMLKKSFSSGGASPRDFDIIDGYIISTNESGNNVCVINCKTGNIVSSEENIKSPLAVVYSGL